jgi:hypothetical protein
VSGASHNGAIITTRGLIHRPDRCDESREDDSAEHRKLGLCRCMSVRRRLGSCTAKNPHTFVRNTRREAKPETVAGDESVGDAIACADVAITAQHAVIVKAVRPEHLDQRSIMPPFAGGVHPGHALIALSAPIIGHRPRH